MLVVPVTRPWAAGLVVTAFAESDIPREVTLILDAPDCDEWIYAFLERGWKVHYARTGNPAPPKGRFEARARHLALRSLSQRLVSASCRLSDRILFSEDDTLVPPDVWGRLSACLDAGYRAASGVQRDRHGSGLLGLWRYDPEIEVFDPLSANPDGSDGVIEADGVGHYCLLTTAETYCTAALPPVPFTSIDRSHTHQMAPVAVDTRVWCGHLTEDGTIIT